MKPIRSLLSIALLIAGLAIAPVAQAATTVEGGPFTNLNPAGAAIPLKLSTPPATAGIYILQCQITPAGTRPTTAQCNMASQLWITNSGQGSFRFTDAVTVNVRESFNGISCNTVGCGLFFRLDHTQPTNTAEDRFIPIQFTGGAPIVLPNDELSVKVGETALVANRPADLVYRTPIALTATALSGSVISARALGTNCSVDANLTVTALKGSGECVIAVTTAGNASFAGVTANYPFLLKPATQSVDVSLPTAFKVTKTAVLAPTTLTTSMGEKVKFTAKPAQNCTITIAKKSITLKAKKPGTCTITLSAPARKGLYSAYSSTTTVTVTK